MDNISIAAGLLLCSIGVGLAVGAIFGGSGLRAVIVGAVLFGIGIAAILAGINQIATITGLVMGIRKGAAILLSLVGLAFVAMSVISPVFILQDGGGVRTVRWHQIALIAALGFGAIGLGMWVTP